MKILQVRFQNLNSLAGSWFIDFTSPDISRDGIFAITGPTGAGKTTILDAVCLALYGRTPRLENVNKSTNEIMTRQTGECSSEIEFLTSKGKFRCHWSQHRARRSASGDLQPQKHEIVDCSTNKVLESKIKFVRNKVVEVTGMDFNQFTRSILLAQGEFNTFLKADPDKRAPILEQITGTEIYSRISIKVHEITKRKQDILNRLNTEIDNFLPLSNEQAAEIETTLSNLGRRIKELDKTIEENLQILDWHSRREKLQTDLTDREKEATHLEEQYRDLRPEREKRKRAEEARKVEPLYQRLIDMRQLQNEEKNDLTESRLRLEKHGADLEKLEQNGSQAEKQLQEYKTDRERKSPLFKEIRAKDLEIQHLQTLHQSQMEKLDQEQKKIRELQDRLSATNHHIETCSAEITTLEDYRDENSADLRLVEELSGIKEQLQAYRTLCETTVAALATAEELQTQINSLEKTVFQQTAQLTTHREELLQAGAQESRLRTELEELLGSDTTGELYRKAAEIQEKLHLAEKLATFNEQLGRLKAKSAHCLKNETDLNHAIQTTTIRQQAIAKEVDLKREAVERQHELALLASRLKNYEKERTLLQDGRPCPLCGSLDHPYIENSCLEAADEQKKLLDNRERLNVARNRQSEILAEISKLKAEREQLEVQKEENTQNRHQLEKSIQETGGLLRLDVTDNLPERLSNLAADMEKELQSLQDRHAKAESMKGKIDSLVSTRENVHAKVARAENSLHSSTHTCTTLRDKLQSQLRDREALEQQIHNSTGAISESIKDFTSLELSQENQQDIVAELEEKRKLWLQNTERLNTLSTTRREHESQQAQYAALLNNLEEGAKTTAEASSRLHEQIEQLQKKRHELYGDKNPDTEEQHLHNTITTLEKQIDAFKEKIEAEQHHRTSLTERVHYLAGQTGRRELQLQDLRGEFLSSLHQTTIKDEEDFLLHRLSEADFAELCEQIDGVNKKIASNRAIMLSLRESLDIEQARKLTESSRQETEAMVAKLQTELGELQQKKGALNQQLQDNVRLMQLHADKVKEFTEQKKEVDRWSMLHELIGSADGKKFRNFAQGITFDIVLGHANRTLQKMSDRYILTRDRSQPLELSIIDNYQAGEIRTIKNLSGGESFLVSMALALGLSSMASRNVQVDSLFLDEGFGTLDEETLQTALDILSNLHQEGKLIGVISHVTGLQERIDAQIQVTRGVGGRSSLSGAGIARPA